MTGVPPRPPPQQRDDTWLAPISIDLLTKVAGVTFLHPFVCWMVPLCLRAQALEWSSPRMLGCLGWATLVSVWWAAGMASRRVAYGRPRRVDLGEEVIVVTGGASGLGMLLAEVYGMRGATVAVLDLNDVKDGGEEARGVTYFACDVGDREQVLRVAGEVERTLGTPTILINNAAVVMGKSLLDLTFDEIDTSLSTNLLGPIYCIKAFLPALIRSPRGGTIVNVSSVIGQLGAAKLADYAAAKAGLAALHASLTAELRRTHPAIRTLLVTPGQLSTPLFYGVQTPNSFFAPVVEPVDVAMQMVAAIDSGMAGVLAMPWYARWVSWYHVLPAGVQLLLRTLSGVDRGMETFVGRRGGVGRKGKD